MNLMPRSPASAPRLQMSSTWLAVALLLIVKTSVNAWVAQERYVPISSRQASLRTQAAASLFAAKKQQLGDLPGEGSGDSFAASSRRKWFSDIAKASLAAAAAAGCLPATARASDVTMDVVSVLPLAKRGAPAISTASACDPAVSVWQRGDRLIYILGTAHVSSVSAQLAGSLVRDVHPEAVFVELDVKRIRGSGILADRIQSDDDDSPAPKLKVVVPKITRVSDGRILSGGDLTSPTSTSVASMTGAETSDESAEGATSIAPSAPSPPSQQPRPSFNPFVKAGAVAVGNAIKGMYKNLEGAGFQSGEEFVVAMNEGRNLGASIVLGDRDVEATLQRVSEALAKTDLKVLFSPDSELEQTMKNLVPSANAQAVIIDSSSADVDQFRDEFSSFVEVMKTKDNVRKIMGQLQRTAPALYEALVSERDAYMAAGMSGLNEFDTMVAVMGIAHVDGVEKNLIQNGWRAVDLKCALNAGQS